MCCKGAVMTKWYSFQWRWNPIIGKLYFQGRYFVPACLDITSFKSTRVHACVMTSQWYMNLKMHACVKHARKITFEWTHFPILNARILLLSEVCIQCTKWNMTIKSGETLWLSRRYIQCIYPWAGRLQFTAFKRWRRALYIWGLVGKVVCSQLCYSPEGHKLFLNTRSNSGLLDIEIDKLCDRFYPSETVVNFTCEWPNSQLDLPLGASLCSLVVIHSMASYVIRHGRKATLEVFISCKLAESYR